MSASGLSRPARRRLLIAAALGVGGYAAYRAYCDNERLRKAVRSTVAELQRCGEVALTRTTACIVAGTVQGIAAVRPQAVDAPAPTEPWQAMALEKLLSLLTSRAGMDLVSLAVAVGAQHSVAALCQHWSAHNAAAALARTAGTADGVRQSRRHSANGGHTGSPTNGAANGRNGHSSHGSSRGHNGDGVVVHPPAAAGNPIVAQLLDWASTPQGERFVVAAMAAAARNSTCAYMDSLGGGNTYDDLFTAAFRPQHREVLKDLTVMATREAVSTYFCPPRQQQQQHPQQHPQHPQSQQQQQHPQPQQQQHPQQQQRTDGDKRTTNGDERKVVVYDFRRKPSSSVPWSMPLKQGCQVIYSLVKQVTSSKAAVFGVSAMALASGRGLVLGCKDAFVRSRAADQTAHLSGQLVSTVAWPASLLAALTCFLALMFLYGVRNVVGHGSLLSWHA